jgi:hypothetical protein
MKENVKSKRTQNCIPVENNRFTFKEIKIFILYNIIEIEIETEEGGGGGGKESIFLRGRAKCMCEREETVFSFLPKGQTRANWP